MKSSETYIHTTGKRYFQYVFHTMEKKLWWYIDMELSSLSVDNWLLCDNLSISWFIFMKFRNKVPNYGGKRGIDFGVNTVTIL